ncbi:MAG: long-chain acyl-CoA synthetase [Oceanicoccus sp.]|jgi:long-chain acyl-CoA synthetase
MNAISRLPDDFKSILEMFYQWENTNPDGAWLRQFEGQGWRDYSWATAGQIARQLAAGLQASGLKPGDKVGIYAENCARWVIADLAIMMAGLVSVPIYTSMPEDKIRYVVEHSDMKLLLVGDNCALGLAAVKQAFEPAIQVRGLGYQDDDWQQLCIKAGSLIASPLRDWHDLWSICYTSGTTGKPKGVMHSFSTLPSSVYDIKILADSDSDTRFFSYLPLAHIAERSLVEVHSFYSGGMIGFNRSKETFIEDLLAVLPTFFFSVPRIWANLKISVIAKLGEEAWARCVTDPAFGKATGTKVLLSMGLDKVVMALTGSAPIPADDIISWRCLGMPLCEGLGQTETMSATFNRVDNFKIGSIGMPVSERAEAKISAQGELLLRSPGNMVGYYKDPQKTAETIIDGWVHTGDKGRIDEDGFVFLTGRLKDIFKTAKGKYVAPAPIEGEFSLFPGVAQCCLVGSGLPQTVMLLVLAEQAADKAKFVQDMTEHMMQINVQLEVHEKMSHVIVCAQAWSIENGLLTHTLKVLRDDVEKHYLSVIEKAIEDETTSVVWQR